MSIGTLVIPLAFIIFAAILVWYLIGAQGKWWLKMACVIALPSFGLAVWKSLDSYIGWPSKSPSPDEFVLIWGEAKEPDSKIGDPGAIYLWLVPYDEEVDNQSGSVFDYAHGPREPRAYQIPYSRDTHEELEKAKTLMRKGHRVMVKRKVDGGQTPGEEGRSSTEDPENSPDSPGARERSPNNDGERSKEGQFEFHELPPPKLPEKK
ncbi:MAG: hypothetical protein AAB646_02070 [Patescibacteria group bacterium]|mgnify:FL=1